MEKKNKIDLIDYFIGILIILVFTWNPNFAHGYIVGPDEGQHLAWINEILRGKTVYKEIYVFYGPLLEFISIIFMKVFGVSLWSLRLSYQLSNTLNIILGFLILRLILQTRAFLYLGLWALLSTKISEFWMARWGGSRLIMGLCAAWFILYYAKKERRWALFWGGIFTSLALFTSQEIGIVLLFATMLFLFFLNFYTFKKMQIKSFTRILLLYLFGFTIATVSIIIYLLIKGAFLDYIQICFIDLLTKYPEVFVEPEFTKLLFGSLFSNLKIPYPYNTRHFLYYLLSIWIYMLSLGYIIWNYLFRKMTREKISLLFFPLLGIPLLLSSFRQIIGEQLALYSLPTIAITVFLLERMFILSKENLIFQKKQFNLKKLIVAICFLILIQDVFFILLIKSNPYRYLKDTIGVYLALGEKPQERFYKFNDSSMAMEERHARLSGEWQGLDLERAKGITIPQKQAEVISEVVEFIKENTSSDEEIFVFPHEGQYYFLTNRASITRFTPTIYASIGINYQEEVVNDLEYKKPRYCIYIKDAYIFTDYNKIPNEKRLNLIFNYLGNNYFIKKQYGQTFILEKR